MTPEDLEREINDLWARVSPSGAGAAALGRPDFVSGPPPAAREAALEAIVLLKRQHRQQLAQWEEVVAHKTQAIQELSARLRAAETELIGLRRDSGSCEEGFLRELSALQGKLEAAHEALKAKEGLVAHETGALRATLEKTRQQLADEARRLREGEALWGEREQGYLDKLRELEERIRRSREDSGGHETRVRKLSTDLQEAKRAVEATLGELLAERKRGEEAVEDRTKANERVTELASRLKELQVHWEEERRQWQELWDRERSTWETQRQEFATWEERLRAERQMWHADLQQKESEVVRFSTQMSAALRESSETATKVSQVLKAVTGPPTGVWARGAVLTRRYAPVAAAAGVVLALGLGAWGVRRHLAHLRLSLAESHTVSLDSPTALVFDGSALWVADWSGRLLALDPGNPATVLARHDILEPGAWRPVALAFGEGSLWSVDSARGRLLRHSLTDPSVLQGNWPAPGPAPAALAHDGQNLWSYDAVTRAFYRHMGLGKGAPADAFTARIDLVPASMHWAGAELWVHDSRGRRIVRLRLEGKAFVPIDDARLEPGSASLTVHHPADSVSPKRLVWVLNVPEAGGGPYSLRKFRAKP